MTHRHIDNDEIAQLYQQGYTTVRIAAIHNVSQACIYRRLAKLQALDPNRGKGKNLRELIVGQRGPENRNWKGGKRKAGKGYLKIYWPDHPMANDRYVLEHRLVMAEHLGRVLSPHETVHHLNGDRSDNRLENLQLRSGRHGKGASFVCGDCGSTNIVPVTI